MSTAVKFFRNIATDPEPYKFTVVEFESHEINDVRVFDGRESIKKILGDGSPKIVRRNGFGFVEIDFKVYTEDVLRRVEQLDALSGDAGRLICYPKFIDSPGLSKTVILKPGAIPDDFIVSGFDAGDRVLTVRFDEIDKNGFEVLDGSYSTSSSGYNPLVVYNFHIGPNLYYYKGTYDRTYLVWTQYVAGSYDVEPQICYFNHESGAVSASTGLAPGYVGASDNHARAATIVTDDGYILAAYEKLTGTGASAHNSPILVKRSDEVEDISSFTLQQEVGDYNTYPKLFKLKSGRILMIVRYGPSSTNHYRVGIYRSDDGGQTWNDDISDPYCDIILSFGSGNPNAWAYNFRLTQSDDDEYIYLGVNRLYNGNDGWSHNYLLRSKDGYTWENMDSSFNKKITGGNYITDAEMTSYFLIDYDENFASDTGEIHFMTCGCISPSGRPYLIQCFGNRTSSPQITAWYLWYFENSEWKSVEITGVVADDAFTMDGIFQIYAWSDKVLDIFVINTVSSIMEVQRWRTENRGLTWTKKEDITSGSSFDHKYLQLTSNAPDAPYISLVSSHCVNVNYADIFYHVKVK